MSAAPQVVRAALSKLSEARVTGEFGDSSARNLAAEYEQTIQAAARYWGMASVTASSTSALPSSYSALDPFGPALRRTSADSPSAGRSPMHITIVNSSTGVPLFEELGKAKIDALLELLTVDYEARERAFCTTDVYLHFAEAKTKRIVTPGNEVEFPWLHKTYLLVKEGLQAQALRTIYWGVEDLLAARQFSSINRVFTQVDLLKLSPEVMIGLVRCTYRARSAISTWRSLVKKIADELDRRAIPNWQNLLVGLETN